MITEKFCPKCAEIKSIDEFNKDVSKLDGVYSYCRACQRAYKQMRYLDGKDREATNRRSYKRRYDLKPEEYQTRLMLQGGRCAICGRTGKESKSKGGKLAVDHSHDTGRVRALLCQGCNHGLANFRDNPESLQRAIKYLERWA